MIMNQEKDLDEEREEFENERDAQPAKAHIRKGKLRWKDGKKENPTQEDPGSPPPDAKTIAMATHILELWNKHRLLEKTLDMNETLMVFKYFNTRERNSCQGDKVATLKLIEKAVKKSIFNNKKNAEALGFTITDEERVFLKNKDRAKRILLDILLANPKLLPELWCSGSGSSQIALASGEKWEVQQQKTNKERNDDQCKKNYEKRNKGPYRVQDNCEEERRAAAVRSDTDNAVKVLKKKTARKIPSKDVKKKKKAKRRKLVVNVVGIGGTSVEKMGSRTVATQEDEGPIIRLDCTANDEEDVKVNVSKDPNFKMQIKT
ncbi:hypothetical protein RB195_004788 [Necator americanus]